MMNWRVCLVIAVACVMALCADDAQAQQDSSATMTIPAPEMGEIRIQIGPPGPVRLGLGRAPARVAPPPVLERESQVRSESTRDLPPATAYRTIMTGSGPAIVLLDGRSGIVRDTVWLSEAVPSAEIPQQTVQAPPRTGIAVPDPVPPARVRVLEQETIERMLLDEGLFRSISVQFEFDRSVLLPTADPTLAAVADVMQRHPDIRIEIGGHTDNVGPADYNRRLSQERAEAVRNDLIEAGVDGDRLVATGFGEERPLLPNQNPTHQALNRRVEFRVIDSPVRSSPEDDEELLDALQESLREALRESLPRRQ